VDDLCRDEQKEKHLLAAKKAADDAFRTTYTFQPQLYSNPYDHIEPKHKLDIRNTDSLTQSIKEMEDRKCMKIKREKLIQTQKELEQCTFSPSINHYTPPQPEGPVVVRGLDRFLELKDLAKKMEEEKREREENAFKVKQSAVGPGVHLQLPFTVPSPFHFQTRDRLAEQKRKDKLLKMHREVKMRENVELTFQPRTNAAKHYQFDRGNVVPARAAAPYFLT